jgi:hypothetical protein
MVLYTDSNAADMDKKWCMYYCCWYLLDFSLSLALSFSLTLSLSLIFCLQLYYTLFLVIQCHIQDKINRKETKCWSRYASLNVFNIHTKNNIHEYNSFGFYPKSKQKNAMMCFLKALFLECVVVEIVKCPPRGLSKKENGMFALFVHIK